jgi:hypothetical protein
MCPLDPPKHEKVFFTVGPHKRFMAGILPSRATKICFGRCQNIKHGIFGDRLLENVLSMASAVALLMVILPSMVDASTKFMGNMPSATDALAMVTDSNNKNWFF